MNRKPLTSEEAWESFETMVQKIKPRVDGMIPIGAVFLPYSVEQGIEIPSDGSYGSVSTIWDGALSRDHVLAVLRQLVKRYESGKGFSDKDVVKS